MDNAPSGARSPARCPSTRTAAPTSGVAFRTISSAPRGTTSGRASSECGAMNVIAIASRPRTRTGPPLERLYAVDPDGVEQIIPSHETTPRSSSAIAHPSSIMRPSVELVATTSLTATNILPSRRASSVGCSIVRYSPAKTRARSFSSRSGMIEARKPTRPKLMPITGTPVPSSRASVRRIVPSPPTATVSCPRSGSSTSSTPARSATARTCATASRTSMRPCATTEAVSTGECKLDSLVEVIGKRRVLGWHEVEEHFPVPLRPREPRVYDAPRARPPQERCLRHLAYDAPAHLRVSVDAALPHLGAAGLELRLHEHDRLPPGRTQPEDRWEREPHRDERDVADGELRSERELGQGAGVRPLEDGDPRIAAQARVELAVADVDGNHARGTALQQDVGKATGRGADVDAVEARRIHAERVEAVRELLAATRDVRGRPVDRQLGVLVDLVAGLVVPAHEPGEDKRLPLRPHVAVRIEDVVHDLEQEPELLPERPPRRLVSLAQVCRPQRHRHGRVEEPARLQPVHRGEVVPLDVRVEVLAADHSERGLGQLARDSRRLVACREPEGLREQGVAGEDADALAELLPRGGLTAPLLVVVHRRQVVVDERERVDELDRERGRHHLRDRRIERLPDRERDHWAHPLAVDLEGGAHGRRLAVQLGPQL